MLQDIHDRSKGWVMYIIVGLLVVVFAMWGIGYYLRGVSGPQAKAATVNGVSISNDQFNRQYQNLRGQFKGALSAGKIADLKKIALDGLIEHAALYSAGNDMGFGLSNEAIDTWISESPRFQENGQFSQSKYQMALEEMGASTQMLRNQIRQSVVIAQVKKGIMDTSFALPNEAKTYGALTNQKRVASYVIVPNSAFTSKVNVSNQEIQQYYHAHKKDFYTPKKIKLAYLELSLKALENKAKGSAADKISEAQNQYSAMGQKLANSTFENPGSLDYTAKQLGLSVKHTGFFSRHAPTGIATNKAVLAAAFSDDVMKNQNNSDVINLSDSQAVVVRIDGVHKAQPKPLSQVSAQIKQILINKKAKALAKLKAERLSKTPLNSHVQAYSRNANGIPGPILQKLFLEPLSKQTQMSVVSLPNGYAVLAFKKVLSGKASTDNFNDMLLSGLFSTVDYNQYVAHLLATAEIKRNG